MNNAHDMTHEQKLAAYREGRRAFEGYQTRSDCLYARGGDLRREWLAGYADAELAAEQIEADDVRHTPLEG